MAATRAIAPPLFELAQETGEDVVRRPDLRLAGVERLLDAQRLLRQLAGFDQPTGLALQEVGEVAEGFR